MKVETEGWVAARIEQLDQYSSGSLVRRVPGATLEMEPELEPEDSPGETTVGRVKEIVHDLTHARGGSVAAEHGVGRLKVGDLERYGDPVKLSMMRAVKAALDPRGILNPGAVLRAQG